VAVADLQVNQPKIYHFVRLKLRILGNGMRGKGWRIGLFILSLLGGLWAAFVGFAAFAASSFASPDTRHVYAAFAGTGVVLAWTFIPLLFFGVDETLDPARFALLPLPRRTLVSGMLAAACIGVPPLATLVATLGSVTGAASRGGVGAVLVALIGCAIGLLLCIAASRAVTSAFAGMLRSRRVRDLAALFIALLGISCGPTQSLFWAFVMNGDSSGARTAAEVLSWTPIAAPYVAYLDAVDGNWLLVLARLAIGVAGIGLLLLWWTRTIESAMLGTASGGSSKAVRAQEGGLVAGFFPKYLRGLPKTPFGALVARESRYWWRHPRRRAGLISLLAASVVIPFGLRIGTTNETSGGLPLPLAMMVAGTFIGLVLVNQFGTDGEAYALHLLIGVPGHSELRTRAIGLGVLTLPLLIAGATAAAFVTGVPKQLPAALGVAVAAYGASVGLSGLISVLVPYPMPDSPNPFAVSSGGGSVKGFFSLIAMVGAMLLTAPIVVAYFVMGESTRWLILPVGIVWGVLIGWVGTYAGGAILDRRAPEVLNAISPKR
jgi:ABC-2 type transport system permease protein